MARIYTNEDKATVHVALAANTGGIRATARDTGVPVATVRDWAKKWAVGGVPAEVATAKPS